MLRRALKALPISALQMGHLSLIFAIRFARPCVAATPPHDTRLDVVAVRIEHERRVIIRLITRADARCAVVRSARCQGLPVKRIDTRAVARDERNV